jgi:hypothetical protein
MGPSISVRNRNDDKQDNKTKTYRSPSAKERLVSAFAGGNQNTIASTAAWHEARMRQEDLMIIIMDGSTGVSSIDESLMMRRLGRPAFDPALQGRHD